MPPFPRSPALRITVAPVAALVLALGACSRQTDEERGRDVAERIQASIVDVEAVALAQPADPAVVAEVQRQLSAINEYQGEINGRLDSVTVNAIQAFQRTIGCSTMDWWAHLWNWLLDRCVKDDGLLSDVTRTELAAAAQAQR